MRICVVKETRPGETRVSLIPEHVDLLNSNGCSVWVECDAGIRAGFSSQAYERAGAQIFDFDQLKYVVGEYRPSDPLFVVRVKRALREREIIENQYYGKQTTIVGFLDPLKTPNPHIHEWLASGTTTISLELTSLNRNDPRNASAAMSRLAGPLAFEDALQNYKHPQKPHILILGTGAAAASAAIKGIQEGLKVTVFGRNEKYQRDFAQNNIEYVVFPNPAPQEQARFLDPYFTDACIIITAARTVGKKAPILIDHESIQKMQPGSSIVDLSGEGGNVLQSQYDKTFHTSNDITITNCTSYPKKEPHLASKMYSEALFAFLDELITNKPSLHSPLLNTCYLTALGKRNPLHDKLT